MSVPDWADLVSEYVDPSAWSAKYSTPRGVWRADVEDGAWVVERWPKTAQQAPGWRVTFFDEERSISCDKFIIGAEYLRPHLIQSNDLAVLLRSFRKVSQAINAMRTTQ